MSAKQGAILIVDDNKEFLIALKILLTSYFKTVITESSPDRIESILNKEEIDLVILDMNFKAGMHTGNEGLYWMNKISQIDENIIVLLITAYGDVDVAIKSIKEGATDFIQKNWDENKILSTVLSAFKLKKTNAELRKLKNLQSHYNQKTENEFRLIKGRSEKMELVYALINKVAKTEANVLITGESGTGKEVIAHEIHNQSNQANNTFVSVDLGAIPGTLFESELFGHNKGAFTDAHQDKPGKFEIASDGTLFLDEIGNLPVSMQSKLLAVLQNRIVGRLGENKQRKIHFRLISATNQSINRMVSENLFREDLLYRINTVELKLPPLRERIEDLDELSTYFINRYNIKYKKQVKKIDNTAMRNMQRYSWPGNVRELQHVIEKAVILSSDDVLKDADFQIQAKNIVISPVSNSLEDMEKDHIIKVLEKSDWNMSRTAKELGINRSTLYDKIRKYELKQV